MENWWFYILMFVFGYITHKTFYFLYAGRLSMTLLKASHVIYLSSMIKAIEHMSYARELSLEYLAKAQKSSLEISTFEYNFEKELDPLKERSLQVLIYNHPGLFQQMIEFNSWEEAMDYLSLNKEAVFAFWEDRK